MTNNNNKISLKTLICYGFGHILNDLCASMWFTYLIIFYHHVIKFSSAASGAALFIGQVADGISTPIIGVLSDKGIDQWWCKYYGHRKTWHFIGTVCVAISFPFIYSISFLNDRSEHIQLTYYSIFIIIFQIGWAAVQVSHLSLVPDLTSNSHERTSLLTIRYSFTVISNIVIHVFTWYQLQNSRLDVSTSIGPEDKYTFQVIAIGVIATGILTTFIFYIGVAEPKHDVLLDKKCEVKNISKLSIVKKYRFYHIICIYLLTQLFVNESQVYITLYMQEYLKLEAQKLPLLPLVMYVVSFFTSSIIRPLNADCGRKLAYYVGGTIGLLACIWVRFGQPNEYFKNYLIFIVVSLFGCSSSILVVTSLGITADLIGNNTGASAFIYGIMSFSDKVANGIAVLIIQNLRTVSHHDSYYRDVLAYVCGGSLVIGLLFVITLPYQIALITEDRELDSKEKNKDPELCGKDNNVDIEDFCSIHEAK